MHDVGELHDTASFPLHLSLFIPTWPRMLHVHQTLLFLQMLLYASALGISQNVSLNTVHLPFPAYPSLQVLPGEFLLGL